MQFPLIHANGSEEVPLLVNYRDAVDAADRLIDALNEAAPNARDYYPISQAAAPQAIAEHIDRLRRVDSVKRELEALVLWISDILEDAADKEKEEEEEEKVSGAVDTGNAFA